MTSKRAYVWDAVSEMELDHYTKREIAAALREVADSVDPDT
jgi:hypothetical protein